MFAKVIILNKSSREDVVFDYGIPEEYENETLLGRRVLVPLGARNAKKEGYIIGLSEHTEVPENKIKRILSFPDEFPFFDEKMLELARWMSREYAVGLVGALKLITPAGIAMKERVFVKITGDFSALSGEKADICAQIAKKGGTCLISRLKGENTEKTLKELEKEGIIAIFRSLGENNLRKFESFCTLTEKGSLEGEKALLSNKRLKNQLELFLYIKERKEVPLKEISAKSSLKGLKDKGFIGVSRRAVVRDAVFCGKTEAAAELPLTREQSAALEKIFAEYGKKDKKPVLLFGVTGSGKTYVYIKLIEKVLAEGKEVIILVPEIALTPLMTRRIYERFGDRVTITHSRLSTAERFDQWEKARRGDVSVIIGPRSAVFAPFKNLGAIIVDEEHEEAFQSENLPAYNAKDIALFRCRRSSALYLAGSATPAVETFCRAEQGEYVLCEMKERVLSRPLPATEITDMRKELREGNKTMFGLSLQRELKKCIEKGEQAMLFINRRGYSSFVSCRSCGYVVRCGHCSVSMTYHARENQMVCHYCGERKDVPEVCPECGSSYIKGFGTGTERVREEVLKLFPDSTPIIMDADTTRGKFGHERILSAFAEKKADILIGTQMIAKGHDFPNVSLVGILAADMSLNTGDFRDGERTFALITQAAGRAGRGEIKGKVFVQTYNPENYAVSIAAAGDYKRFFRNEIQIRRTFGYPPFNNFFAVMLWGADEKKINDSMNEFCDIINCCNKEGEFGILGPADAYKAKLKDMFRKRIIISGKDEKRLKSFVYSAIKRFEEKGRRGVFIYPAFNPLRVI